MISKRIEVISEEVRGNLLRNKSEVEKVGLVNG
jgi:hypothetical protein